MTINKNKLFSELLNNFLEISKEIESVIISDEEGLIIAGEKRKDIDMEIVSFLTAVVNPVMERFRNEFAFKKFGTANFDTEEHRILFISIEKAITLSLVFDQMASIDKLSPYAYFLAEKTAQILNAKEEDLIDVSIPKFEYEAGVSQDTEGIKPQEYEKLASGFDFRLKFIIIGDHMVGKTSIIYRFVEKKFLADYRTTIGLNIMAHNFEFFGNRISLWLWDIGAQQYFKRYRKAYYNGAQAAFIVFDLTNRESYDNIIKWYEEFTSYKIKEDLSILIIGNKRDLTEQRVIDYEEGMTLARLLSKDENSKVSYIETSALTGENVEDAFGLVSYHYIMKSKKSEEERLKEEILEEINSILERKYSLILSFITQNLLLSPGLQLLTEIEEMGDFSKATKKNTQVYVYSNKLILKNSLYNSMNISGSSGVFCIFDARNKEFNESKWKDVVKKIIEKADNNTVVLIGIMAREKIDWSQLMKEFDIEKQLERKLISFLFFKIEPDDRREIYNQLKIMLSTINNL